MDEGKHERWGADCPDLQQFKELNYTYPPCVYRPQRRAFKPRHSPYPVYELGSARLFLLRHIVEAKDTRTVKAARLRNLLGVPGEIDDVVKQHVLAGVSYDNLEPNGPPQYVVSEEKEQTDSVESIVERVTSPANSRDSEDSRVVEFSDDIDGVRKWGKSDQENQNAEHGDGVSADSKLKPSTCKNDDYVSEDGEILDDETNIDDSRSLEERLVILNLVQVIKCDYCPFIYEISRECDTKLEKLDEDSRIHQHLETENHYAASSYFAKKIGENDYELTELQTPLLVNNQKAYLQTVLAICPECGLVMQNIHQAAVHYRYTHDPLQGKYGLVNVMESCYVPDLSTTRCSQCETDFDSIKLLKNHAKDANHFPYKTKTDDGEKLHHLVPCPLTETCSKIFPQLNALRTHFSKVHSDILAAPGVCIRTFPGRKTWTQKPELIKTFVIPTVSDPLLTVIHKTGAEIEAYDRKVMKTIVFFFRDVHSYPAKPMEKAFLSNFQDKGIEYLVKSDENIEKQKNKLYNLARKHLEKGDMEKYEEVKNKCVELKTKKAKKIQDQIERKEKKLKKVNEYRMNAGRGNSKNFGGRGGNFRGNGSRDQYRSQKDEFDYERSNFGGRNDRFHDERGDFGGQGGGKRYRGGGGNRGGGNRWVSRGGGGYYGGGGNRWVSKGGQGNRSHRQESWGNPY